MILTGIQPHFMVVPSLACPAHCGYCFGPHTRAIMTASAARDVVDFIARVAETTGQPAVHVTIHGGEPLMAGAEILRLLLEGLRERLGLQRCRFALQSNLWRLDDKLCRLFSEHQVSVSTSLDGPEAITDEQRGVGYFRRTLDGLRRAQSHGLEVGYIATFTPASAPRWREVFDFFLGERIHFSIHPAIPPLNSPTSAFVLPPQDYGRLLCDIADHYIAHRRELAINSLDQACRSLVRGVGRVCTFCDCAGMFLALGPDDGVWPCQRFTGRPEWRLGTVAEPPDLAALWTSPAGRRFTEREAQVTTTCAECPHLGYCRGGCPYNAWTENSPERVRDPHCTAYRALFDHLHQRLVEEIAAPANIAAIATAPSEDRNPPWLRRGALIELAREGPHPYQMARTAKRIVAAVELARGPDLPSVAARLVEEGIARTQASGERSLAGLLEDLHPPQSPLNNLYLHVTFRCQLNCRHCYARADAHGHRQGEMPVATLAELLNAAQVTGFSRVVITGGEPLIHRDRDRLLDCLKQARRQIAPKPLVLRTNLALPLGPEDLRRIAQAVDQVVVSVDGDEASHDARRGAGSHAATVRNLEAYAELAAGVPKAGELSLAAVLPAAASAGPAGASVQALAARLGIRRVRVRPLLPLGRAADWDEPPASEALGAHLDPWDLIVGGFRPVASCGLGRNLYVEPSGEAFPCYAYHRPHASLGNVCRKGLANVVASTSFQALARHSVDTNPRCRDCKVRYLCGGACRAWGGAATQIDPDAPPPECAGLKTRAVGLWQAAWEYLGD